MERGDLATGLAEGLGVATESVAGGLVEELRDAVAAARKEHPSLSVGDLPFARHVGSKLGDVQTLASMRVSELYFAFAVASKERTAVEAFETLYGSDIDRAVRKTIRDDATASDLAQQIRAKLLVGLNDSGPQLATYGGRGSLQGWLRIVASRTVVDAQRSASARPETSVEPEVMDVLEHLPLDPSTQLLRHKYQDEVKGAMEAAFAALDDKQRRLLRGSLVQRLRTDDLGALFGVHRTTAARWLEDARLELVAGIHAELRSRLDAQDQTVRSLIDLVRSGIDVSIARLLDSDDG